MFYKVSFVAIVLILVVFLQSCAGTVGSQVRESDKDASSSFDGMYAIEVDHPGGRQSLGSGWFNDCGARKFSSQLSIQNSNVSWKVSEDQVAQGYINSSGKFRLELPLDSDQDVRSTSEVLSDGGVTLILQGDLDDKTMKGLLVFGIGQFNGRGCGYPVTYSSI